MNDSTHLVRLVAFDLVYDFVVKNRPIKFRPSDFDDDVLGYDGDANASANANDCDDNLDSNCMPNYSMPFHQLDSDHYHTFQCPSYFRFSALPTQTKI